MVKKPSISELIGLLDKPALLKWANKQGLAGVDISAKRKEWLNDGTGIHSQIEHYIRDGQPFLNSDTQSNFVSFMADKKVLSFEKDISTEYFTGRYDMKLEWNGRSYLVDFKKSAKGIYFEHKLQLVAYSMAEPVDSFAIVCYPEFRMMNFSPLDRTPYIDIIKSLSNIYKLKRQLDDATS
jgi:hypothetical protein